MRAWPHGDPNVVVRGVLAQPAFRTAGVTSRAKPPASFFGFAWNWFVDHVLRRIFPPLAHALAASRGIGTALGVVLIVCALGALGFALVRLALAFVRRAEAPGLGGASVALAGRRTPGAWRAAAAAAAARGDYAPAIAALFSAALAMLDVRALVAFDAARTPGEYRRLVRRAACEAALPFDELSERYVRAAYAAASPSATDFAAAERALAAFEPGLRA